MYVTSYVFSLPTAGSGATLAKTFASYFVENINKIRNDLGFHRIYTSTMERGFIGTELEKFKLVTVAEILKVIERAKLSTSMLDPCPHVW